MVTNHKVQIHKWIAGRLETIERFFTREEDARSYMKNEHRDGYTTKLYNRQGEILHTMGHTDSSTYA